MEVRSKSFEMMIVLTLQHVLYVPDLSEESHDQVSPLPPIGPA